jgi:hypothetical protein
VRTQLDRNIVWMVVGGSIERSRVGQCRNDLSVSIDQ